METNADAAGDVMATLLSTTSSGTALAALLGSISQWVEVTAACCCCCSSGSGSGYKTAPLGPHTAFPEQRIAGLPRATHSRPSAGITRRTTTAFGGLNTAFGRHSRSNDSQAYPPIPSPPPYPPLSSSPLASHPLAAPVAAFTGHWWAQWRPPADSPPRHPTSVLYLYCQCMQCIALGYA